MIEGSSMYQSEIIAHRYSSALEMSRGIRKSAISHLYRERESGV